MKNDIWCENPPQCSQWNSCVFRSEHTTPNENREKLQIYSYIMNQGHFKWKGVSFPIVHIYHEMSHAYYCHFIFGVFCSLFHSPFSPILFHVLRCMQILVSIKPNRKTNIEKEKNVSGRRQCQQKIWDITSIYPFHGNEHWTLNIKHSNEYTKPIPLCMAGYKCIPRDKCTKKQKSMFHRF